MMRKLAFLMLLLGSARAQRFGRGGFSSHGSPSIRLSPGSFGSGSPWSSRTSFGSSSSRLFAAGSPSSRRIMLSQGQLGLGQLPQTSQLGMSSASFPQSQQPQVIRISAPATQDMSSHRTHQTTLISGQPQQIKSAPQPRTVPVVQPQQVIAQPQPQVQSQVQATSVVQQPAQIAQTVPAQAPQPVAQPAARAAGSVHLTGHGTSFAGMGGMPASPFGHMNPLGMMSPMNPMSAMMGGVGMMAPPMFGMGMPMMSYDTMEDLYFDPDRPDHMGMRGRGMAPVSSALRRGMPLPAAPGVAPAQPAGQIASAHPVQASAVQPAAPGRASPAGVAAGTATTVDQSMITSALQAALGRVQQTQAAQPLAG